MRGILQSREIWATDVLTMNDEKELLYGHGMAATIVAERGTDGLPLYVVSRIADLEDVRDVWKQWCTHLACFSVSFEIESQWTKYADMGRGFALGFDSVNLETSCHSMDAVLFPVVYHVPSQEDMIKECLRRVTEIWKKYPLNQESRSLYLTAAIRRLVTLIITLKHPTWTEEQEWRILVVQTHEDEQAKFKRYFQQGNRCYFRLPLCTPGTLKQIILGSENPSEIPTILEFAQESGFPDVQVTRYSSA